MQGELADGELEGGAGGGEVELGLDVLALRLDELAAQHQHVAGAHLARLERPPKQRQALLEGADDEGVESRDRLGRRLVAGVGLGDGAADGELGRGDRGRGVHDLRLGAGDAALVAVEQRKGDAGRGTGDLVALLAAAEDADPEVRPGQAAFERHPSVCRLQGVAGGGEVGALDEAARHQRGEWGSSAAGSASDATRAGGRTGSTPTISASEARAAERAAMSSCNRCRTRPAAALAELRSIWVPAPASRRRSSKLRSWSTRANSERAICTRRSSASPRAKASSTRSASSPSTQRSSASAAATVAWAARMRLLRWPPSSICWLSSTPRSVLAAAPPERAAVSKPSSGL